MPTHELQRLGSWKTAAMVGRYAIVALDDLRAAAYRLDSPLSYATAVPETLGERMMAVPSE